MTCGVDTESLAPSGVSEPRPDVEEVLAFLLNLPGYKTTEKENDHYAEGPIGMMAFTANG